MGSSGFAIENPSRQNPLVVGQEYTVTWDGVDYKTVAADNPDGTGGTILEVNAGGLVGVMFLSSMTTGAIFVVTDSDWGTTRTIKITTIGEIVHKFDPKYLPEPIVFTYFDDDMTCICNMSFNDAFKALTSYQDVFLRMDVASANDIVMHKYIRMTANYYMDRGSVENGDYEIGMMDFQGKTDEDAKVKITYNADGTIEIIIN